MLSISLSEPVISIDVSLSIDEAHSWSCSFFSTADTYAIGSDVTIYRDGEPLLIGVVTGYSYDAATQIMTVSGIDKTSFADQNDHRETTLAADTPTTVTAAIESVKQGTVTACPTIHCFGYGTYNGSTQAFVDRVANAFGLNWYVNPVGSGYVLSSGDIATPVTCGRLSGWSYHSENNYDDRISHIFIQKAITSSSPTKISVKNTGTSSSQTVRLQNPNAIQASAGSAQFPMDYWIDPWNKCFVTIDVPVAFTNYNQATDIGSVKQVTVLGCSDSLASPAWHLELWAGDPGAGTENATLLEKLSVGQTWTSSGSDTATHARVARNITPNDVGATKYPAYDGVEITAYTWSEIPGASVEAWSDSFSSGDTGRPDYNIICDEMYPNHSSFVSQGLGTQIAGRDSVTARRAFTAPGTPAIGIKGGYELTIDGVAKRLPATSIHYTNGIGIEQVELGGEW